MKYLPFSILTLIIQGGACAQAVGKQEAVLSQVGAEQRRAELRLILGAPYARESKVPEIAAGEKPTSADRHLTDQERRNLRQQLQVQRDKVRSD
jgi:hypothetical protein